MIGPDNKSTTEDLLRQEAELKHQIAFMEQVQRDLKDRTPVPSLLWNKPKLVWTPDNPRSDDQTKCKCGATATDPHCYCEC